VRQTGSQWDQRIDRARALAEAYSFSSQILGFYSKLTAFQKDSYLQVNSVYGSRRGLPHSLPPALDEVDLGHLISRWAPFLAMIASEAPTALAEFARDLNARGPSAGAAILRSFWRGTIEVPRVGPQATSSQQWVTTKIAPINLTDSRSRQMTDDTLDGFCAQAFLQPYAEYLANYTDLPEPPIRCPTCPYCASPPLVAVLRPEGDGAKRSLICWFCRTEWDYLRIACPVCEERDERSLCVYHTPPFDCVRVDVCNTCRTYIKTIDLTKDGRAIPEVDELATLPLTLWADQNGYSKVTRNIMGL
jgi:Protein involved in formate dehydrogenase formation